MTPAFIAFGSNLDPAENVRAAVRRLALVETVVGISTVYLTVPEDRPEQPLYYNGIVAIRTSTPPMDLKLDRLRTIEQALGRTRTADKYAARTIDLDLVWYDDLVVETPELTLPDPQILKRPFLAIPLGELAPDLVFPNSHVRLADVVAGMDGQDMVPLMGYTDLLRRETAFIPAR